MSTIDLDDTGAPVRPEIAQAYLENRLRILAVDAHCLFDLLMDRGGVFVEKGVPLGAALVGVVPPAIGAAATAIKLVVCHESFDIADAKQPLPFFTITIQRTTPDDGGGGILAQ